MPVLIFGQFTEDVQITEQPQSQPVRVGSTVTLRCKATGYPAPQYQWVKDGTELPDGIDEELTFDPVTLQDSGKYVCIVSNRINAEKTNKVELQVLPSPGSLIEVLQVTLQYQCPCYLNCIYPLFHDILLGQVSRGVGYSNSKPGFNLTANCHDQIHLGWICTNCWLNKSTQTDIHGLGKAINLCKSL